MNKAFFLDRDGVLNLDHLPYQHRMEDFEILPDVVPALQKLRDAGFKLIIISNQGGIAKGIYKHSDTHELHDYFSAEMKKHGITLDAYYYCPHHPSVGKCICRKPDSLLLEKAMARFKIDAKQSFFIGDMDRDIEAGKKAGVNTIQMRANSSLLKAIEPIVNG